MPNFGFLPFSQFRTQRIKEICIRLKELYKNENIDVVFIQEAWLKRDRDFIKRQSGFPYCLDLDTKNIDSGLMILSRFPFDSYRRITYVNNIPLKIISFLSGEIFPNKSAIFGRMVVQKEGKKQKVWVGNTHLVSFYGSKIDPFFFIRKEQFKDFLKGARSVAQKLPLILGGDWNFNFKNRL